METYKILLVEDEPFLSRVLKESLEQRNYLVSYAPDGEKAYGLFKNNTFSLCIVDVMLPLMDGFSLVERLRKLNPTVPILFLTAKTSTEDLIKGYKSGGNDYLRKPFSLDELFLRIEELLNRPHFQEQKMKEQQHVIGQFLFSPHKQELRFSGKPEIKLSHKETELLLLLYKNKNAILDRKTTLVSLWRDDNFYNTRTMDVFITKLRKHLKQDPNIEILNIRGLGYKLIC